MVKMEPFMFCVFYQIKNKSLTEFIAFCHKCSRVYCLGKLLGAVSGHLVLGSLFTKATWVINCECQVELTSLV